MKRFISLLKAVLSAVLISVLINTDIYAQCGGDCGLSTGYQVKTTAPGAPITFTMSDYITDEGNSPYLSYSPGMVLYPMVMNSEYLKSRIEIPGILGVTADEFPYWPGYPSSLDYRILSGGAVRIVPERSSVFTGVRASFEITDNFSYMSPVQSNQMILGYKSDRNISTTANDNDVLFLTAGSGLVGHTVISNTRGGDIKFATGSTAGNDATRMTIANNGQVSIGRLPAPSYQLSVGGSILSENIVAASSKLKLTAVDGRLEFSGGGEFIQSDADYGIGIFTGGGTRRMYFRNTGEIELAQMEVAQKMSVGGKLQSSSPHFADCSLSVKGKLVTTKLITTQQNWADYVFDEDYALMDLDELEGYIKTNKHLPGIPTAAEVREGGVDVGEMNRLLLEKVEELTLRMIDQQKQLENFKSEVNFLRSKISE